MSNIGIKARSLKEAKLRCSKSYVFIPDPSDQRRILVEYDSLKTSLKEKAHLWLGECPHAYYRKSWIKSYIEPDAAASKFFKAYYFCGKGLTPQEQIDYYTAIQWLNMIKKIIGSKAILKANNCTTTQFWDTVCTLINKEKIKLPGSYPRLTQKLKDYHSYSYRAVIKEGNFFTDNAAIIKDDIADWLIAQYELPLKRSIAYIHEMYNDEAPKRGWKLISHADTIRKFLYTPEVKQKWYGGRHGDNKAEQKYGRMHRTSLPVVRDAMWESDGTKLNFFDRTGKLKASWTVYEVLDVYSEKLLGYHISKTEDHVAQYHAYKMAFQVARQKPFEIKTDNQGGHKKMGEFLSKLAHIHIRTKPYNGSSKTIESVFGRMQQQVMRNEYWFFTGQNITAKKLDSRANMEFIIDNIKDLPSEDEIFAAYARCREIWNNKKHPRYKKTRNELYLNSKNDKAIPVDELDMIDLFWLETKTKYTNGGIILSVTNTQHYYEVLDKDGMPDFEFRRKYIGATFVVKYDPENLLDIRLYETTEDGLRFIAVAEPYIDTPRALQDHTLETRKLYAELSSFEDNEAKWLKAQRKEREKRTGISAEDLIRKTKISLGQHQKALANADVEDWEDVFIDNQTTAKRQSALGRM